MKMQFHNYPKPLLVLVGPTAVGKTDLSIKLAKILDAEIVSADSRYFYRGMDIGTAKPTMEERDGVPHHMIDIADPDEILSLGFFQKVVEQTIEQIHNRNRIPFLVGGTGQYVRAIIEGWQIPEQEPDPQIRQALENWAAQIGKDAIYDRLRVIDPDAAKNIDPSNVRRTIRALEVIFLTGKRFSDQRTKTGRPYSTLILGLTRPRAELYARIDMRIETMISSGLVDEVRDLLVKGYSAELPSLSAIGYREIIHYLSGTCSLEEAIVLIKRATRQFVRRQANWFKPEDPSIRWFQAQPDICDSMLSYIQSGEGWLPADASID